MNQNELEIGEVTERRKEIDGIDDEIARLFRRRMEIVDGIAESKRRRGAPVSDPARERMTLVRIANKVGPDLAFRVMHR